MKKRVFLSLGSNLGDRKAYLDRALEELPGAGVEVLRVSPMYESEPVDYAAQPWFLNCVVEAATEAMPLQLLHRLQQIENRLGRRRGTQIRRGPRTIDIDILLYGNQVISTSTLTVPHPRMTQRRFVLEPLRELSPDLRHPVSRRTVGELLSEASGQSIRKL